MLKIPDDILEFFFHEIKVKGKYEIKIDNNQAFIIPRKEEAYYKVIVSIKDLNYFELLLMEYINALNEFNKRNGSSLKEYHDLSYIFNILLFNLAPSDADDLNRFLEKRISFLEDNSFSEYLDYTEIFNYNNTSFKAKRCVEEFGLETPYIMLFQMENLGITYDLPLIRYAVDNDSTCYIYAVQIGRGRICPTNDPKYKGIVNKVNQGVKEDRDISPSFVLVFSMFLKMLHDNNINKIVIPDFLFNRYKKYYRANTVKKSNEILGRMTHNIITLVNRIDGQIDGFNVQAYPLDVDSYYHIDIIDMSSENLMLKKLLKDD